MPEFISLGPRMPAEPALLMPSNQRDPNSLNVVLHPTDDPQWSEPALLEMFAKAACWERKIHGARFQYCHLYKACWFHHLTTGPRGRRLLFPGAYEDPLVDVMAMVPGVDPPTAVDPQLNGMDLAGAIKAGVVGENAYDLVLGASVLEHVSDDAQFLRDILYALAPGGLAYLTCDFQGGWRPGMPLAPSQRRLYTHESLLALTDTIAEKVTPFELEDGPHHGGGKRAWQDRGNYFTYGGIKYAFASIAFQKRIP